MGWRDFRTTTLVEKTETTPQEDRLKPFFPFFPPKWDSNFTDSLSLDRLTDAEKEAYQEYVEIMVSPKFNLPMEQAAQGEWVEAMRQMLTTPGNIAIAVQNDGEIFSVWDRNRLQIKLTPSEQIKKSFGLTPTRQREERDLPRIMRHNERKRKAAQRKAIDEFIAAAFPRDGKKADENEVDLAIGALAEAGVTSEQVKTELEKKDLTPTMRAFLNLPKIGKANEIGLLDFQQ